MSNIHEKIRELRKQKGINQKQVADSAGLSVAAYSNIESGETKSITIEAGKGIAKALGVSFAELFEIETPATGTSEASAELEQLREKVKELEKRIDEKDLVIHLLKKDNQQLTELQAWDNISEELHKLLDYEIGLKYGDSTENERVILQKKIEESINYLKKAVDNALVSRYIDIPVLLGIFIQSGILMEDEVNSKEEYIKECTLFFNRFFSVKQEDVAEFVEKNEITKWDTDKLKQLGKKVKKWARREHIIYKRYKNSI
jgi:transcriptional regulator with XRE-family HTH domain